jgi:hypothetical protein
MIQRKQSIFLLTSVVLFALTFAFPFGKVGEIALHNYAALNSEGLRTEGISHYFFSATLSVAAVISMISIFLYNNRQQQMSVLRLSFIFFAASFALLALYIKSATAVIQGNGFSFGISFFLPFGSFLMNMLALRSIRKDEQLVKSLDRLR